VDVPAFAVDQYKVTNGQYLDFILAGGYETRSFWTDNDWNWKTAHGISHPVFWRKAGDHWFYRTMFAEMPLPLDWPVYVSHAEAARMHGGRESRSPLKRNGIVRHTGTRVTAKEPIHGGMNRK